MPNKKRHGLYLVGALVMMFFFVNALVMVFQFLSEDSLFSSAALNPDAESVTEEALAKHYYEDIDISNDFFDEIIMSNDSGLIYDGLNEYSGRWLYFDRDDIYSYWELTSEDSNYVYLQMRKELADGYSYSRLLVLDNNDLMNSKTLSSSLKDLSDCSNFMKKINISPVLMDKAGNIFNYDSEDSGIYEFSILDNNIKIALENYKTTVNFMDEEMDLSLLLVLKYDDKVLDKDIIFKNISENYQVSKEVVLDFNNYCDEINELIEGNYIIAYNKENYKGQSIKIKNDISDLSSYFVGVNDISSIKIIGDLEITVYAGENFTGKSEEFSVNSPNMTESKLGDNNIESIKIKY